MRKWIVLTAVFLCLAIAGPAQALQISMTNSGPQYWDFMNVQLDDQIMRAGAGRFYTTIHDGEKEIDTFSYCVQLDKYFSWFPKKYEVVVNQPTDLYLVLLGW